MSKKLQEIQEKKLRKNDSYFINEKEKSLKLHLQITSKQS
jgi:hypothetical protein